MVEIRWMDSGRDHDPLLAIRERADNLKFNTRRCAACGTEFEAANPRKQTCSAACRQALSRSKRYGDNSFLHSRVSATVHQRHSSTVTPGGHTATVTEPSRPEPKAKPASGRSTLFDDPEYIAMQEKMSRQWDICKADAKVIGCKPERVQQFKAAHKIKQDRPLSVDAQQLLREELDNDQRSAMGEAAALDARLVKLRQRATPERLAAMQKGINRPDLCGSDQPDHQSAREYLCGGLELVGLKPQRKITTKLLKTLQDLMPAAAHFPLSTTFSAKEAILWGAVLRLGTIDTEPPTDTGNSFLAWCQFFVTDASYQRTARGRTNLADLFQGRTSANDARRQLGLPEGVELTKKAINDAFKSLAKQHHPDAGGDAAKFQRITEAKGRLMLEVAA